MTGAALRAQRVEKGLSQARFSELCKVPQAKISAFELGKADLSRVHLKTVTMALANDEAVRLIGSRRKRYRSSSPRVSERDDRSPLFGRSEENPEYLETLRQLAQLGSEESKKRLNALSIFAGCGGMSLGLSAAGFKIRGFIEKEPGLRDIYSQNFPSSQVLGGDISKVDMAMLESWSQSQGPFDLLAGGPPCQGFSLAGKRKVNDERNVLFEDYLRVLKLVRPKFAVLENVRLLTSMKDASGNLVKNEIAAGFEKAGYSVRAFEVNAKDYGVPQHRERLFFLAARADLGILPSFPDPEFGVESSLFAIKKPIRTFADACSDLQFIESAGVTEDALHCAVSHPEHVLDWLWDVPQGRSAHENPNPKDRPPSGYNTTYKRQVWNEPAGTVQTTFGMISGCRNVHPIATRSLTIREAARIQSFPDGYKFPGNLSTVRTGIGNAVPPLLALAIGRHIVELLS